MKEILYEIRTGEDLISPSTATTLMKAAKWAKLLAIVGFVILGLALIGVFTSGSMMGRMFMMSGSDMYAASSTGTSWGFIIGALIVLAIYFIPLWYLFQFARQTQKAFSTNEGITFRDAADSLRKYYTFIGILMIIWLFFMVIGMIMAMVGMGSM